MEPPIPGSLPQARLTAMAGELARIAERMLALAPRSAPEHGTVTSEAVRAILRARRMRRDYLGADLFVDPAWDMLLDLLAARLERKDVSVSSLCMASGVPPTTALRWIGVLERRALVKREPAPGDGRKVFIRLADEAADRLLRYLVEAGQCSEPVL